MAKGRRIIHSRLQRPHGARRCADCCYRESGEGEHLEWQIAERKKDE